LLFGIFLFLAFRAADLETGALERPALYAATDVVLALVALLARYRTNTEARSEDAGLQFDDPPEPAILSLGLYRDGVLPIEPTTREPRAL
jgi:hypothetical protein